MHMNQNQLEHLQKVSEVIALLTSHAKENGWHDGEMTAVIVSLAGPLLAMSTPPDQLSGVLEAACTLICQRAAVVAEDQRRSFQ